MRHKLANDRSQDQRGSKRWGGRGALTSSPQHRSLAAGRVAELESADRPAIDADEVVRSGLAALRDPPRLLETANIEGRKEFVRAYIGGITVRPETRVLDLQMKKLPALGAGNFTCEMVAGARYEQVQIEMRPLERFVAGLWRAA